METPFLIPSGSDGLCGVLYEPAGAPVCGLVMCHPLFEERKGAHRVMVEAARSLAAGGCRVIRFDYRGCGDSPGDLDTFGRDHWLADIAAAVARLRQGAAGLPVGLLGVRLGAALALQAAAAIENMAFAVLWEPVVEGRRYLDQELRRKLVKEMVTFGQSRVTRASLLDELAAGRNIDLDGYPLTPALFAQINAFDTASCARRPPPRTLVIGVTPAGTPSREVSDLRNALAAAGAQVELSTVAEDPFWSLVGLVECPELVRRTTQWVLERCPQGEVGLSRRAPTGGPVAGGPPELGSAPPAPRPSPPVPHSFLASPSVEQPVAFEVEGEVVRGVWHTASGSARAPVVVCLHGWAGSRLGPHRMFVPLARRLAACGCPCLRIDFRGRGDSEGVTARASIRTMVADARAALEVARERGPGRPLVLLGICSGGKVAIGTAAGDPRVDGLILWSSEPMGPMREKAGTHRKSASALGTYARKLLRAETWRKLVTFRVNLRMVRKAVTSEERAGRRELEDEAGWLRQWRAYRGRVLFVYGTNDPDTPTARAGYTALSRDAGIPYEWRDIEGANHSFYSLAWEREVLEITEDWIRRSFEVP